MKPEAINKAIAEWCGWTGWYCTKCKEQVPPQQVTYDEHHSDPDDCCGGRCEPYPDYYHDLNAVHEAILHLNQEQLTSFVDALLCLIHEVEPGYFSRIGWQHAEEIATAKADVQATALVKSLGLWRDGE